MQKVKIDLVFRTKDIFEMYYYLFIALLRCCTTLILQTFQLFFSIYRLGY